MTKQNVLVSLVEAQVGHAATESEEGSVNVSSLLHSLARRLRLRRSLGASEVTERQPVRIQTPYYTFQINS